MNKCLATFILSICVSFLATHVNAQTTGNIMLGWGMDIIKSDINGVFGKVQTGAELNYFVNRSIGLTGGVEIWSTNSYALLGIRWYPDRKIITRFRALVGQDTEFAIGAGYAHVLSANWRLEGLADYYLDSGELGLRIGIAYIFRK
jgi:hypothetical protein